MNALLDHVWGRSAAQDRVWAQVTGMAPSRAVRRLLMVLQAFIDESETQEGANLVLGGHIATGELWSAFAKDWEELLPYARLGPSGKHRFKMREMAGPDHIEIVRAFYNVIEKHRPLSVSIRMNTNDYRKAIEYVKGFGRLTGINILMEDGYDDPYYFLFFILIDDLNKTGSQWRQFVGSDEKLDFIFDKHSKQRKIDKAYYDFVDSMSKFGLSHHYGSAPRFHDDEEFEALQAADLWSWWVRKWHDDEPNVPVPRAYRELDFGSWNGSDRPRVLLNLGYDRLIEAMDDRLASALEATARDS